MLSDLDHISFAEWLIELNICAVRIGLIGKPLTLITGQLRWYPDYLDGQTPMLALETAIEDDVAYGEEYEGV